MRLFKQKNLNLFLVLLSIFYLLSSSPLARADIMTGSRYQLDTNISNIYKNTNNANSSKELSPQINEPQTNPNVHIGENYKLVYPAANNLFVFSISKLFIDYGVLSPNNPVKRTNTISVLSSNTPGYTVRVIQNHKLQNPAAKTTIPDTSCDTGTCSKSDAALWNNALTYGFGYRCDNLSNTSSCVNDFYNTNYYKRFPSMSESYSPEVLIEQTNPKNTMALITYQVNISRSQQEDFYNNAITFIATPNF